MLKRNPLGRILVATVVFGLVAATPPKRSVAAHPDSTLRSQFPLPNHDASFLTDPNSNLEPVHQTAVSNKKAEKTPHRSTTTHQRQTTVSKKTIFVASMAFVTGCVDTVCYRRYKCFVNMMTGNVIKFSIALAESQWEDALFHSSLIVSYIVGVGTFRALDIQIRHGNKDKEAPGQLLTLVAPLILSLFILADMVSHYYISNPRIHAPLLSIGFGIMNAASADATGGTILYAMTGHINRMGKTIVDYWMLSKSKCLKSFKSHLRIVACFAAGIAFSTKAAQLVTLTSSFPMATTAGIMFAAMFVWYGYPAPIG